MNRCFKWALVGILMGVTAHPILANSPAESSKNSSLPNIIVILADDLGYGDVGCNGAKKIKTPNIDRLAAEGVNFTDAHSPASICQPSRYGLLAGRYIWRKNIKTDSTFYFNENEITLPKLLKAAGYKTACIGKWHLGLGNAKNIAWEGDVKPGPQDIGFDYFYGTPRSHNEPPFVLMENQKVIGADPKDPIEIIEASKTVLGYGHGISLGGIKAHKNRPEYKVDIIITEKAVEYVNQQSKEQAFFMYLPFVAPHVPLSPSPRFQGTSEAGVYGDFVQELDWCVGEVLQALDKKGLSENTMVIFTSDNGACINLTAMRKEHRSNAHFLGQKTDAWEGGHRVPFIVRHEGHFPAGKTSQRLISLTDIMATCLDYVGLEKPDGAAPDSLSQVSVLKDPSAPAVRSEMILQSVGGYSLRSGPWVYIPGRGSLGFTAHQSTPWGDWKQQGFKNSDIDNKGKYIASAPENQLYNIVNDESQTLNVIKDNETIAIQLDKSLRQQVPQKNKIPE